MKRTSTGECVHCGTLIWWKYYTQVKLNELELHDESHKQCISKKVEEYTQQYIIYMKFKIIKTIIYDKHWDIHIDLLEINASEIKV